jgi:oxygen-independent coproporphyrinogen-3 oxidase
MKERLLSALVGEMRLRNGYLPTAQLDSIYLGGGTPSVLTADDLMFLFNSISELYSWDSSAEITLEANPDDLDESYLRALKETPINRLSIGLQARGESQLEWMNRSHNASQGERAVQSALSAGFDRLTVDWMYGLPGLTNEGWIKSLEWMDKLEVPHFSAYALTVEERTVLAHQLREGKTEVPKDEAVVRQFDLLMDWVSESRYEQYEISNFARPGCEAVHNSNYWTGAPYLGLGPSAHSYDRTSRQWNINNNMKYMRAVEAGQLDYEEEELSTVEQINERIMTQLRLRSGIDVAGLSKDFPKFGDTLKHKVLHHSQEDWWEWKGDTVRLSQKGKHFADRAAADLFF